MMYFFTADFWLLWLPLPRIQITALFSILFNFYRMPFELLMSLSKITIYTIFPIFLEHLIFITDFWLLSTPLPRIPIIAFYLFLSSSILYVFIYNSNLYIIFSSSRNISSSLLPFKSSVLLQFLKGHSDVPKKYFLQTAYIKASATLIFAFIFSSNFFSPSKNNRRSYIQNISAWSCSKIIYLSNYCFRKFPYSLLFPFKTWNFQFSIIILVFSSSC